MRVEVNVVGVPRNSRSERSHRNGHGIAAALVPVSPRNGAEEPATGVPLRAENLDAVRRRVGASVADPDLDSDPHRAHRLARAHDVEDGRSQRERAYINSAHAQRLNLRLRAVVPRAVETLDFGE